MGEQDPPREGRVDDAARYTCGRQLGLGVFGSQPLEEHGSRGGHEGESTRVVERNVANCGVHEVLWVQGLMSNRKEGQGWQTRSCEL